MTFITVRKLIHIVQIDDGRSFCDCFIKSCFDFFYEISIGLVLSANKRRASACFNNGTCHKRLSYAGLSIKEQTSRSRNTKFIVDITISEGICNLLELFLDSGIADNHIKFAHRVNHLFQLSEFVLDWYMILFIMH